MTEDQHELEGKAWWVQLHRSKSTTPANKARCKSERASDADSVLRPSHSGRTGRPAAQRPATTGTAFRPLHLLAQSAADASPFNASSVCGPSLMRPSTFPKLPARRALSSRQGSFALAGSAAASRALPLSRGNDWSPVHSRPATREAQHAARAAKLTVETAVSDTQAGLSLSSAAGGASLPGNHIRRPSTPAARSSLPADQVNLDQHN